MDLDRHQARTPRNDWSLSQAAFDRLLAVLGPDVATAGERYERIRQKLARLFEWRGCDDAARLVDLTFDRVARRLEEGAELTAADPYAFLHGVALHVLQEHWRGVRRAGPVVDAAGLHGEGPAAVHADDDEEESEELRSRRLSCLDTCLRSLPVEARRLLEAYHAAETPDRIAGRQALAAEVGLTPNALRIQAYRLRARMQACIGECLAQRSEAGKRIAVLRTSGRGEGERR